MKVRLFTAFTAAIAALFAVLLAPQGGAAAKLQGNSIEALVGGAAATSSGLEMQWVGGNTVNRRWATATRIALYSLHQGDHLILPETVGFDMQAGIKPVKSYALGVGGGMFTPGAADGNVGVRLFASIWGVPGPNQSDSPYGRKYYYFIKIGLESGKAAQGAKDVNRAKPFMQFGVDCDYDF